MFAIFNKNKPATIINMNSTSKIDRVNGEIKDVNLFYHDLVHENYIRLVLSELRNSLNFIIGGISLINKKQETRDDYSIKLIEFGASSIISIIDIISDITQLKSNKNLPHSDLTMNIESFFRDIEMDINRFIDITDKPKIAINYCIINTDQILLNKGILHKIIKLLLFNIVHSTDVDEVKICFSLINNKYNIRMEGTTNFIPLDRTPYIFNIFNKPNTITNKKYLQEPRILFQVFINQLLKVANAEIEVIASGKQGVTFNIIMPNSSS